MSQSKIKTSLNPKPVERKIPVAPIDERRPHGSAIPRKWKRYGG